MTQPLRVLCLDIEGGHGGSSRSLFEALAAMDREAISPEVWCRREGPVIERYGTHGIPVRIEPSLPKASALPRLSRNLVVSARYARDFMASGPARARLLEAATARFDLVHFNHEAYAVLALWLRHKARVPAVMHLRTNLADTVFARLQQRAISRAVDARVFITANEEASYRRLGGTGSGRVILNPVPLPQTVEPNRAVPRDGMLNVASISNFALVRGTDRLIDIAAALPPDAPVRFVMAGDMRIDGARTLKDTALGSGLADRFIFLGHVSDPERILAACDLLIKPTREANPWGRDIIEAMAQGRPVISYGRDATFVETGETGVLMQDFDAKRTADALVELAANRAEVERLGRAARDRVARLCDPTTQARALADVWRAVMEPPGA